MIDLKKSISIPNKESMEIDVFLHQKNLVNESMLFHRRVESKEKTQGRKGEVK